MECYLPEMLKIKTCKAVNRLHNSNRYFIRVLTNLAN